MAEKILYRNYEIYYDRKPVPPSLFGDWSFAHVDFDGAPDGPDTGCSDHRCGYGRTIEECKAEIDAQYEDFELDETGHYPRRTLVYFAGQREA